MTSSAALLADRIAGPGDELHDCLDRVSSFPVERLSGVEQAELLRALTRAEARLGALRLRVLAVAETSRTAARSGAASTGQWAATISNADPAAAHRQVVLARRLESRTATRAALTAGDISAEHAGVIVRADEQLPASVSAGQRAVVEQALIYQAQDLSPAALRRAARRALAAIEADVSVVDAHENELVAAEEEGARVKTRLTLHDNEDGTVTGHFTVPTMHGHLLRKMLEAMTAPRRGRLGASHAQVGDRESRTDWDRARGLAFCELIEHVPTEHLHPKTAATLVVTIAEDALREALRVAGVDTGGVISAGEARRLACNAGIYSAVLGGQSLPLDLGRSSRLYSESQRIATGLAHATCAADGCERPFAWCEMHHEHAWSCGGTTDLKYAIPLCHFHHQRIHDPHYRHDRSPAGGVVFRQRT